MDDDYDVVSDETMDAAGEAYEWLATDDHCGCRCCEKVRRFALALVELVPTEALLND